MTVQQLIDELSKIEDKSLTVITSVCEAYYETVINSAEESAISYDFHPEFKYGDRVVYLHSETLEEMRRLYER